LIYKGDMTNPYKNSKEQLRQVMAWYPNKRLYKRKSAFSGKPIVTIYPEEVQLPVYSHDEWYSDSWDPPYLELYLERSFFEQFAELQKIAPVVALLSNKQENAEYCQDVESLKNSYMVWDAIVGEDLMYCSRMYNSRNCVDCYWIFDSELLYDCTYCFNCYNSRHCFNCKQVSDSAFLYDCRNVQNSFMCYGLRNVKYHIYNRPYPKEEYEAFMAKVNYMEEAQMANLKSYFLEEIVAKHSVNTLEQCEDSTGRWLKECKNVKEGFESLQVRDGENIFQCAKGSDIEGSFMCNDKVEQCFQCVATGIGSMNVKNCAFVWHSNNLEYCYLCLNCQDCFGCIGIRNKRYHILNKPYSKEEYEMLVPKLVQAMKVRGEYPLFFPQSMSPFCYEDTIAYDMFEKTPAVYMEGRPIHYTSQELNFYEKHSILKPTKSYPARLRERMELMGRFEV